MLRIGLTGGIASGKSTVAELFAGLGAGVVDTDAIARELVVPGSPALAAIVERFGSGMLTGDGRLDRRKLRETVFDDSAARRDLEAILHPRIREAALAAADTSAAPYVLLVVPLLFESGFDALVDATLVVDCPEAVQIARLIGRDGGSPAQARAIVAAQMPREERLAAADEVIDNGGDPGRTRARVAELHARYLEQTRNCSSP